LIIKRRRTS